MATAAPATTPPRKTLERRVSASPRDDAHPCVPCGLRLTVAVLGASGDLARKKTFPALFTLFDRGFLPPTTAIIGYARSPLTCAQLRDRLRPTLGGGAARAASVDAFLERVTYVAGAYDVDAAGWADLAAAVAEAEAGRPALPPARGAGKAGSPPRAPARPPPPPAGPVGRLIYLALPPSVYPPVLAAVKAALGATLPASPAGCDAGWARVIVEKPFGRDLASSEELAATVGALWPEESVFRIDHYLGKELMQNMIILRFHNEALAPSWCRDHVANVQITFKEDFGTEGRGGYFDQYGIIRDVIQNHLTQVLALVAMDKPLSLAADDVRDRKVEVLRCVRAIDPADVVLGQYGASADGSTPAYKADPTVPPGSNTPTFAAMVLYVDNDRWAGVPFIVKAGKALNERAALVRIQFRPPARPLVDRGLADTMRNELVVRLQPREAIYMKVAVKRPGLDPHAAMAELDLDYADRYGPTTYIPDAYERLLLDAVRGDQSHFVRRDELRAAWAVFDDLLAATDRGDLPVHTYAAGTRGPPQADELAARVGYVRNEGYEWGGGVAAGRR